MLWWILLEAEREKKHISISWNDLKKEIFMGNLKRRRPSALVPKPDPATSGETTFVRKQGRDSSEDWIEAWHFSFVRCTQSNLWSGHSNLKEEKLNKPGAPAPEARHVRNFSLNKYLFVQVGLTCRFCDTHSWFHQRGTANTSFPTILSKHKLVNHNTGKLLT